MLTQERLKEIVEYDPDSGVFSAKKEKRTHKKKDSVGFMSGGYLAAKIDGKTYFLHRLAFLYMTGSFPSDCVDHENRLRTDNRWSNLRPVSRAENRKNHPINIRNTSGHQGISFRKDRGVWIVRVGAVYVGYFKNIDDAISARDKACFDMGFHNNHGKPL
jgi:hypothetical protein